MTTMRIDGVLFVYSTVQHEVGVTKRGLGVLLVLALIVAGATLGQDLRFDNSLDTERAASRAREAVLAAIDARLVELRASQAGYVATGQDSGYWMSQVATLAGRTEADLSNLVSGASDDDTRGHYEAALLALADFNSIDDRARSYVGERQLFLASDLVFMDAPEATRRIAAAVDRARALEQQAADARVARVAWIRFAMNAVALAFLLVVSFAAVRAGSREVGSALAGPEAAGEREGAAVSTLPADPESQASPAVVVRELGLSRAGLDDAAELCADLARLINSRDLPAIVERTAKLLDAKGIVLWAADTTAGHLQPALTHGYSERVVKRLGSLDVSGDNVTSLAFRSLRPQTMNGSSEQAPGAVAVPLITTAGCVGVLAAETRSHRPGFETLALARIVAAQFSTVVQPVPSPAAPARQSAEG